MKKGGNPNPNMSGLKPVQKGEIRNPKGKPKGTMSLTTLLKRALEQTIEVTDPSGNVKKITKKDAILINLINKAASKIDSQSMQAINTILDRVEGKVVQRTETQLLDEEGKPTKPQNTFTFVQPKE